MTARYAVYFAPAAEHPLWQAGSRWLGRDARAGESVTPAASGERQLPWRYGFHATLKAPMALAPEVRVADWLDGVAALAARQRAFAMPPLQPALLQDFLALRPTRNVQAAHPLRRLADACVTELDAWRAPLSATERARQLRTGFTTRQRQALDRWGYAHVLDDWRFHMTLSGPLADSRKERLEADAVRWFAAGLGEPLVCDALCVFQQAGLDQPFFLTHRLSFGTA